jgi:hypothetical protein
MMKLSGQITLMQFGLIKDSEELLFLQLISPQMRNPLYLKEKKKY